MGADGPVGRTVDRFSDDRFCRKRGAGGDLVVDLDVPTVLRDGPYRFFFYSADRAELPHVHVEREANVAKFWLDPVRLQDSGGFGRTELARLEGLVTANADRLLKAWHDFFAD